MVKHGLKSINANIKKKPLGFKRLNGLVTTCIGTAF